MSLERKSLTELRGIAQAMGLAPRWDLGKEHLLQEIKLHTGSKIEQPEKPIQVNITGVPDNTPLTTDMVEKALKDFCPLGLHLSFPDERTWAMECNGKKDSGTMAMPIWNVIQCARSVVSK